MKKVFFILFAASLMLFVTPATAQSNADATTQSVVKGDINEDGRVDIGDINAVIEIMAENGTIETKKYYWYVGSMSEADALNPETLGNIVNGKNATSSRTGISTVTIPNDAANEVIVFVYPEIWGRPDITYRGYGTGDGYYKDEGFELPAGYNASFWVGDSSVKGETLNITWSK